MSELQAGFTAIVKEIGKRKPLVSLLGPGGKTPACAALVFAMGGKFTRAVAADAEALSSVSQAVLFDLDQLSPERGTTVLNATRVMKEKQVPLVMVVTGTDLVPARRTMALTLLNKHLVKIVRGNYNECASLLGEPKLPAGVTVAELSDLAQNLAGVAAQKFACVFCVDAGSTVYISDGKREVVLNTAAAALLSKVPAQPVLAGAVAACCAGASADAFTAAALGQVILGEGAVLAKHFTEKKDGPGTFAVRLVDGVYNILENWDVFQMQLKKMETKA